MQVYIQTHLPFEKDRDPERDAPSEFNVDPNVMGDDIKMKLSKQKLEKLIMEEEARRW